MWLPLSGCFYIWWLRFEIGWWWWWEGIVTWVDQLSSAQLRWQCIVQEQVRAWCWPHSCVTSTDGGKHRSSFRNWFVTAAGCWIKCTLFIWARQLCYANDVINIHFIVLNYSFYELHFHWLHHFTPQYSEPIFELLLNSDLFDLITEQRCMPSSALITETKTMISQRSLQAKKVLEKMKSPVSVYLLVWCGNTCNKDKDEGRY